ncbi:MAG: IS1182 family transposase [Actinobacteria bacterium]|nr:MAG: IS1182 family transposase [Actinomycetota bacterium]
MPQNFIAADRDQAYLMPPSLRDWLPPEHLVWTVLEAVGEMDLSAFYGDYRADGHGRPAYEPSMMVALHLYAYARGNCSSRGIERECQEDIADRVIAANLVPDHSTIAEFRRRHEAALAQLFVEVLSLCRKAGLVRVGAIAIDGTKIRANASRDQNRSYESIVAEIMDEHERIDRDEDERHGDARGDELPQRFRSRESRRAALAEAKRQLEAEREHHPEPERDHDLELDTERLAHGGQGRRGWLREGRHQLDERREREARPIARSRSERLRESKRRLEEELAVEVAANDAYEAHHTQAVRSDGRRFAPPRPYQPPTTPEGRVNLSDPDSRVMRTKGQPTVQGYNAQVAVTEDQIIVAAEIATESPDFGHLAPAVNAAVRDLDSAGVSERTDTVLADAGYWHKRQMESIVSAGTQVLIPPDSDLRENTRPGWSGGLYAFMRRVLATEHGQEIYRKRKTTVEPVIGQIKHNRRVDQFRRRGRSAVRAEWRLVAATHNLLKLHSHCTAASST